MGRSERPGPGPVPRGVPLVETHLHFEGSIPPRALSRLARRHGLSMAIPTVGRPLQRRRGFEPFLEGFIACVRLLRDRRDVFDAADALFTDLRREGQAFTEVIFSPQSHLRRGLSLHDLVQGLNDARLRAEARGGPRISFIADGGRLWGPSWMEELVEQVAPYKRQGVVAVGLGGDERLFPARRFRKAFERAARLGLGRVAHAGEGTPPRSVLEVLDHLGVDRIGHGIGAAGSPGLMKRLAREGTVLEVCPTSNLMTGAVRSLAAHPLRQLVDAGVAVTLGSDDRTLFGTTLRGEYRVAVERCGLARDSVPELLRNAVRGSFAPPSVKHTLLKRIA